jgi:hypothetical protein
MYVSTAIGSLVGLGLLAVEPSSGGKANMY